MVQTIKYSTGGRPTAQRFADCETAILPTTDLGLPTAREAFERERSDPILPRRAMISTTSAPFVVEPQRRHIARDGFEFVVLTLLLSGAGTLRRMGRHAGPRPGDILISDSGSPPETATSEAYREARLYVDRGLFEARVGPAAALAGAHLRGGEPLVDMLAAYLQAFVAAVPGMTIADAGAGMDGVLHLLAGVLDKRSLSTTAEDLSLASIRALADAYIARRLADLSLDVAAIVRDLGVSRTKLYTAFAERGGVRAAIRDARLERVRTQLADPALRRHTIDGLARQSGYADYPSFARAFRRRFGIWPSDCRTERPAA